MANRFRTLPQPLDPTLYEHSSMEWVPDITALDQVTNALQKGFDESSNIPVPKHIPTAAEIQDVRTRYLEPLQNMRDQAVDKFSSGSIADGVRALKTMQQKIWEMKQPGGLYDQYEQSYNAYSQYKDELSKMQTSGKISGEKKDILGQLSLSRFGTSFDEEGIYSPFSGISAVEDVAVPEKAIEIASGWKADQTASGRLITDGSGQYMYANTRKFVDPEEVMRAVKEGLKGDPATMAYLRQEADIRGLSPQEAEEFIDASLNRAAAVAAEKEGFVQDSKRWMKNWALEQSREHDFQKMMETGQLSSNVVQVSTGMKELDFINQKGELTLDKDKFPSYAKGGEEGHKAGVFSAGAGVLVEPGKNYESIGIDQIIKNNPEFAEQNPGLTEVVNAIPRYRSVDGVPEIIPAKEYNKKVQQAYEKLRVEKGQASFGIDTFEDPKQIQNVAKVMDTQFGLRAYTIIAPDKEPAVVTPEKLQEELGLESPDDMHKRFVPVGVTRADSPWGANSYLMAAKKEDGTRFHVIASPTDEKAMNYAQPFINLLRPNWDMKTKSTDATPIYNPNTGETMYYRSEREIEYNEDTGEVDTNIIFYEGEPTEDGGVQWQPTDLTVEDITEAATLSNPFHPAKRK